MFASDQSGAVINLESFLNSLKEVLSRWSEAICAYSKNIPEWAASYTDILYSAKSIPPVFLETDKIYISYEADSLSTSVKLIGTTKEKKLINRKLAIKDDRRNITLTSTHKDFLTTKTYTCSGEGRTFEQALNNYFLSCDLKKSGYNTNNIQKGGDAFLLPQVLVAKGDKFLVEEIVNAVRKLIELVPEKNCDTVLTVIQKNMACLDKFLETREYKEIVNYYDARLWIIVESVCKYFDPLHENSEIAIQRKALRDHLIAESCSKLMRGISIVEGFESYFKAMKMQNEILELTKQKKLKASIKLLLLEYKKMALYPEIEGDRVKIIDFYNRCLLSVENNKSKQ